MDLLTLALDAQRKKYEEAVAFHKKELSAQLSAQKKEYDAAIERYADGMPCYEDLTCWFNSNLSFVDRLIVDKEELAKQCEQLTSKSREVETKVSYPNLFLLCVVSC